VALVLKLTLAPALVAAATFVARRLGNRAAGLVSGLPVVAAPIVLVYAVEQGEPFARVAAQAAVLGIISQVAFCVAYSLVALRAPVWPALAAGWLAFALGTLALSEVYLSLVTSTLLTLAVVAGGAGLVGRLATGTPEDRSGDDLLAWRPLITAALVLALTAAAGGLSAHLAGLLVPFPIITAVLAGFTHVRAGGAAAIELLSGLLLAMVCFLAFFTVLAAVLTHTGAPAAFAAATGAALACWSLLVWTARRRAAPVAQSR
jgi:hypothetical protein